ncbi:MAG: metalloregulator ArsR/SmtB family transcription factor [Candidatus Solibacter sp.]
MTAIDRTLTALAEPTRRGVVELLRTRPYRAGELAEAMSVSAPLMSRHLRTLRTHGLIEETHADPADMRLRTYRLRHEPFDELHNWVQHVESLWGDQLAAFRDHVERKRRRK